MSREEIVNKLFTDRYQYLLKCATNILKNRNRLDLATTLVNDAYLQICENIDKYTELIDEGKIEGVVVRWMQMQIIWNNTQFKKEWVYSDYNTISFNFTFNEDDENANIILENIIESDETSLEDHLQYNKTMEDKLNHISQFVKELPLHQQLLFKDIYIKGINTSGKLAKHTGISRTGCYWLMKDLKDEIKNNYKN